MSIIDKWMETKASWYQFWLPQSRLIGGMLAAAMALLIIFLMTAAHAHDHWINQGGYRNGDGEFCCGENDCLKMDVNAVEQRIDGYSVNGMGEIPMMPGSVTQKPLRLEAHDFIKSTHALKSRDNNFWCCARPDHTCRCFFAPPPST